jgi:hypothetical protein
MSIVKGGRKAFDEATRGLNFTKDFHTAVEAVMHDPTETHGRRFMAWLKRRAWGKYRLYAMTDENQPATQADAAAELGIDKRIISNLVAYYEKRGYLYREEKILCPVIAPQPGPALEKVTRSPDFAKFLDEWKVAHSSDFQALEVARSTVKRLRKVILSSYKQWLAPRTTNAATAAEDVSSGPGEVENTPERESGVGSGFIEKKTHPDERTAKGSPVEEGATDPSVRPSGWHDVKFRKARLRSHLTKNYTWHSPPDDVVLDPLADLIATRALFDHFTEASKDFVPKKGWKGFLPIARSVVAHHGDYGQAKSKSAGAGSDQETPLARQHRQAQERRRPKDV